MHWAIKASSVQLITHVGRVWLKHTFISPCTHFPSHQGNVIHNSTFQRGKYYILGQERDLYIELKIIIPHMHIPNILPFFQSGFHCQQMSLLLVNVHSNDSLLCCSSGNHKSHASMLWNNTSHSLHCLRTNTAANITVPKSY